MKEKVTCYFHCDSSFEKWCDSCREKSSEFAASITVRELLSDGVAESGWKTQGVSESSWVDICIGDLGSWSSSNKWSWSSGGGYQWSWDSVVGHCGLVRGGGDGWGSDSWSGEILSWSSSYEWRGSGSLNREMVTVN